MTELNFRMSQFFVESLHELVGRICKALDEQLVVEVDGPEDDEDLLDAWKDGLFEAMRDDCQEILELFQHEDFGSTSISLTDEQSERVLRACAAIRLKIQQVFLTSISDEDLETGDIDFYSLLPDEQKVFACYLFLADLQERIIAQMNPGMDL